MFCFSNPPLAYVNQFKALVASESNCSCDQNNYMTGGGGGRGWSLGLLCVATIQAKEVTIGCTRST
jgi:hypothetical protein